MRTLLIGDVGTYLSSQAKKIDKKALLLTDKNYKKIQNTQGVFYTSLADISVVDHFCETLLCADKVVFCPPLGPWSDQDIITKSEDKRFTLETETREHLYQLAFIKKIPIENLPTNLPNFHTKCQITPRVSNQPQIWNIGCSITIGLGIEPRQRYGELVAKQLNMPVSILAYEGSSVAWAADQILLADVLPGDIILWGLTSLNRYSYLLHDNRFYHVNNNFYKNYPLLRHIVSVDWLESNNNLYHSLNSIAIVKNFATKTNGKLILLGLMDEDFYEKYIEFEKTGPRRDWVDLGYDNRHPGPKQHEIFAQIALDAIRKT